MKGYIWLLAVLALSLTACGQPTAEAVSRPLETAISAETVPMETTAQPMAPQLLAKAESEAQAQEIARLYGITLVEFRRGLAAFYTEENPKDVIARREQGWPELYHNNLSQAF